MCAPERRPEIPLTAREAGGIAGGIAGGSGSAIARPAVSRPKAA
ncbi:hypothetical protein ACFWB2_25885 [Streptomyces virginiae]